MGMFDKDKEMGLALSRAIPESEHFILWRVAPNGTVDTKLGEARSTRLTVSRIVAGRADHAFDVTTLASAVADKAADADPGEFPVVVFWTTVPTDKGNDALIVQYVRNPAPEEVGEVPNPNAIH